MANTKQAKKTIRSSARQQVRNTARKRAVKESMQSALSGNTKKGNQDEVLKTAYKAIDKAVKTGVLKKNTAARRKARVAAALKEVK